MTTAQNAAWALYVDRINESLRVQLAAYESGERGMTLSLVPPTKKQVGFVQAAIDEEVRNAQQEILFRALDPIRIACDAIDNSKTKSAVVLECRAAIEKAYEALHALKRETEQAQQDVQEVK